MAKQLGFVVDIGRCLGCHSCELGCKNFNALDPEVLYRHVNDFPEDTFGDVPTRVHVSLACNHCEDPACLKSCPVKAIEKREADGIVFIHEDQCIGCKMCTKACPYGVPQYNERKENTEKCHMCYERVDIGLRPGCVSTCPVGAIDVVDISELTGDKYKKEIPGFPDPSVTHPSTRFVKPPKLERIEAKV